MNPDLLKYQSLVRIRTESRELFDPVRKKFVAANPEEWVRQLLIQFLLTECKYPINRMSVERGIVYAGRKLRYDLAIHDRVGAFWMIFEIKAPEIPLNPEVSLQISRYNPAQRAPYLVVCNGLDLFCWHWLDGRYMMCESLPSYPNLGS